MAAKKKATPSADQQAAMPADELSSLKEDNARLKNELDAALAVNESLKLEIELLTDTPGVEKAIAEAPKTKADINDLSFVYDGVKYGFAFDKISIKGMRITAEQVAANIDLQYALIRIKCGMIKPI